MKSILLGKPRPREQSGCWRSLILRALKQGSPLWSEWFPEPGLLSQRGAAHSHVYFQLMQRPA